MRALQAVVLMLFMAFLANTASANPNGYSVVGVGHSKGSFEAQGAGRWVEKDVNGNITFQFQENGRDDWSVYLYDASRDVHLQLDLHRKLILYAAGAESLRPLYNVLRASDGRSITDYASVSATAGAGGSASASASSSSSNYNLTRNAAIRGHNTKKLQNVTVEQCQRACDAETSFQCRSFDYYKYEAKCDLSDKSASDVGGLKTNYPGNPYDHYARSEQYAPAPNASPGQEYGRLPNAPARQGYDQVPNAQDPEQVVITIQNYGATALDIFVDGPDGQPIPVFRLEPRNEMQQLASPGQVWRVAQGDQWLDGIRMPAEPVTLRYPSSIE